MTKNYKKINMLKNWNKQILVYFILIICIIEFIKIKFLFCSLKFNFNFIILKIGRKF